MKKREAENLVEKVFICQSSIISQILDSMYWLNSYEFFIAWQWKLEHFLAHSLTLPENLMGDKKSRFVQAWSVLDRATRTIIGIQIQEVSVPKIA